MTTRRIISIKLTPDEIAEIIKAHLEAEGFEVGEDVDFSIETVTVGYGVNEQDVKKFGGCKVTCSMVVGGK